MSCLNEKCSTTRNLNIKKPIVKNHPNDKNDKFETVLFLPEIEGSRAEGGFKNTRLCLEFFA